MIIIFDYCQISIISTLEISMKQVKVILAQFEQLSEVFFFMAHNRSSPIIGIFGSEKQKYFYNFAITNLKYTNIECQSIAQIQSQPQLLKNKVCVIMDIPTDFQTMQKLLKLAQQSQQIAIVLMRKNRKYINMIKKKLFNGTLNMIITECPSNSFIGINRKFRDLVDQSYDMNRAAFYAYGAYLNNYRANLLKFVFKTQDIDVAGLARSYGFTTPPRVKEGLFLKAQVRKMKVKEKVKLKKIMKRDRILKKANQTQATEENHSKMTSLDKIKALAAKKTKKIMKQRQKTGKVAKIIKKSEQAVAVQKPALKKKKPKPQ